MTLNLTKFMLTGEISTPTLKRKKRRNLLTRLTRQWGQDTNMSQYYIIVIYDLTSAIVYLVGGLGSAEKMVDQLTVKRKQPHELQLFVSDPNQKDSKPEKLPYKVVSKNGRHSGGVGFPAVISTWKKVIVVPNKADFHFMVYNHKGRQMKEVNQCQNQQ